jgi:predicted nuclease of predicted toxin-antitoxin system
VRLLLDAHISHRVADALAARGYDVVAAQIAEFASEDDDPLWRRAIGDGRVLVTCDTDDFPDLYRAFWDAGIHHPGLVLVPPSLPTSDIGAQVAALLHLLESDLDLTDRLVYLQRHDG